MYILGISAWYHDSAACLIENGKILSAVQEERFTRKKHDSSFPKHSINFCLNAHNITFDDIESIVFYEKPFIKFERILETYLAYAPIGFKSFSMSMPVWIKEKLFQKNLLSSELESLGCKKKSILENLNFSEHHLSHAASAFYPSPFESAAILTLDGVGEWTTTSLSLGKGSSLEVLKEIHFPHSLGLLYSAFTYFTGFKVNSGEYKLMGLAPYGEPKYINIIKENLIDIKDDGSFRLNMDYFDYCTGLKMTNTKFNNLFDREPRIPEQKLTQKDMDLASSIQKVTEEVILKLIKSIKKDTGENNLCMAGGVALNCVANGVIQRENIFENIWIQPAAGDAGGSLGAALASYYLDYDKERKISKSIDSMNGSYLGPSFNDKEIESSLNSLGAKYTKYTYDKTIEITSKLLTEGKAIGWMQGNMEFGPRALGNRSILADPRSDKMQKQLNLKVKYRESFRPFAPSVLRHNLHEWFDIDVDSPYMLLVAEVKKNRRKNMSSSENKLFGIEKLNIPRSEIPAITHIDYTARIQTVHKETNKKYHDLISSFYSLTGCPILVNTSFNVRGEPIVCSPDDAFNCFMGTELDALVVNNFILLKDSQNPDLIQDYKNKYDLD